MIAKLPEVRMSPCQKPTQAQVGFSCCEAEVGPMERISEFERIVRILYQASWIALALILACTAMQYNLAAGWPTYLIVIIYGLYLVFHMKYEKPANFIYFSFELLCILLLEWLGHSPLSVYLFPMLILRRAAYVSKANVYPEVMLIGVTYMAVRFLHGQQNSSIPWMSSLFDVLMFALVAALAQSLVQVARSLQADREYLRSELNKAEASYRKAQELALRDGLTGLYNYRAFQEHINGLGEAGFAILLIDVDHFKDFNDRYGHIIGDQVLTQIGQVIMENVRRGDKVFRYGGEEFAVVLEDTDHETAKFTAERIRARVAQQDIECEGQTLTSVTISLGVAVFQDTKISAGQILDKADKALYEAKARGRNNVVFFIDPSLSMKDEGLCLWQ